MGLRDVGASLPPGFRFYPSDEELVLHYLYKKITNEDVLKGTLEEIDLHTCEPWQLPEVAKLNATEWYFFSFRDRKYATGFRTNRATTSGYWKATGKDRTVFDPMSGEVVGMRKTLVFYRNRAPNGIKTGWIMHEFRLETPHMPPKEDWVLCRVFHKGKTENSTKLSPQDMYETIAPSLTNQTMPIGYNQFASFSSSMTTHHCHSNENQNNSLMNLRQFSKDANTNCSSVTQISPKCDDGYGFLWDMDLEDHHDGVSSSNLEGMRFEVDNNNCMVLL
ncbi:protein CUP-SHAPED COTYLEDON 3-like [Trifolium pratense]|uniref:protein CUP-SHAPED COTYLEDON 3-like n=1 Tax=Trifolium pratense TaxID=57577 RepID=UPI001E6923A6|nr:protein CUP-SHAPED COTYLEDON 3-like [Trifolium pratense]